MPERSETNIQQAFHEHLLTAISELRRYTRAGISDTLRRIETEGGLKVAKNLCRRLKRDDAFARLVNAPGALFQAALRAGRIDLSIEGIVLEPEWASLFTPQELAAAAKRLEEHGCILPVQRQSPRQLPEFVVMERALTQFKLNAKASWKRSDCETTAATAVAVGKGSRPVASSGVRKHLDTCQECRNLHRDLVAAYERFDQEVLTVWLSLLKNFEATLKLEDEDIKRFVDEPEYAEEPEDYEAILGYEMAGVRDLCAWRAVQLGCHIGRFMGAFASTFAESNLWQKCRQGEIRGGISDFIREMDEELFVLGLNAENLLVVRPSDYGKDDLLFLPSDGDLTSVPGILQVDNVSGDLDAWVEVLGDPPHNQNFLGVLYVTYQAALGEAQSLKSGRAGGPTVQAVVDHLLGMKALLESQQIVLESHQAVLDEIRSAQEAEIAYLERMVAYMSSSDRIACEETLIGELRAVYGQLLPEVRCQLMAAEQIFRNRGFAAPGLAVSALAAAFEVEIRRSLMPGLLEYLKFKGTRKLLPPSDWTDTESDKAVYKPGMKPESLSLGPMERLLRHPEPAVGEYFVLKGLSRTEIREALLAVLAHRNEVTHVKRSIDIGTAEAIRNDWLRWRERPGGIFAVLFRSDPTG